MKIQRINLHVFGAVQHTGETVAIVDDKDNVRAVFGPAGDEQSERDAEACLAALQQQGS